MASNLKLSKLAGLVATAASIMAAPGVAQADALAQSVLNVTNFTFTYNNTQVALTSLPTIGLLSSATFGGIAGTPVLGAGTSTTAVGPNAGAYAPGTEIPGLVLPGNFAGGHVSQSGSAIVPPGAVALTDATVSIVPQAPAGGQSSATNQLGQQFQVTVAAPGTTSVGISFDADLFLRAYLDSGSAIYVNGSSQAAAQWNIEIFRLGGGTQTRIARWEPGSGYSTPCVAAFITNCVESSPFSLQKQIIAFNDGEDFTDGGFGSFSAGFDLLGGQTYRFSLTHISQANADLTLRNRVPEPGTLALSGLALLGLGAIARRRKAG